MPRGYLKITFYTNDKVRRGLSAKHNQEEVVKNLQDLLQEYTIRPTAIGNLHTIIIEEFQTPGNRTPYQIIKNRFRGREIRRLEVEPVEMYKPSIPISS